MEKSGSADPVRTMGQETSGGAHDGEVDVFDSRVLFRDKKEIGIRHEGQLYRLRKTRYGKLILNK